MDLEELFFPLFVILLILGLISAAVIYVPNRPFLGFHLFILSIACLISSVVFLVADLILTWPLEEQTYYHVLRTQNNSTSVEATTPQPQRHRLEKSEVAPTKEQLQALKEALGLEEGSLQYKKRGQGIYAVLYSEGKHHWNHLGSWKELRQKLDV